VADVEVGAAVAEEEVVVVEEEVVEVEEVKCNQR